MLQEDLARKVNLSRASIINVEQGKMIPRGDKVFHLGMVLKIDLRTLATEVMGGRRYVA